MSGDEPERPNPLRHWLDDREPHEQGAVQTILLCQVAVGAVSFAVLLRDGSPPAGPGEAVGGLIGAGTLGTAPALLLLLLADASHRRVTWGWPPWRPEPWLGAAWQAAKVAAFLLIAAVGGRLLAALWDATLGAFFAGPWQT